MPAGVPGARLKWISRLATVTPHPARSHGRADAKLRAKAAKVREHGEEDCKGGPRTERRMDARRHPQQQGAGTIPAGAEHRDGQHTRRQADHPVCVFRAQQEQWVHGAVLGGAREENQRSGADGEQDVPAQRVDEQRQCLKREHSLYSADNQGKRELADARPKPERKQSGAARSIAACGRCRKCCRVDREQARQRPAPFRRRPASRGTPTSRRGTRECR